MITKEQITEILNNHAGYMDRSRTEQAVHEDNFNDVADDILSKLSQHDVSGRSEQLVCIHDLTRLRLIGNNITCLDCGSTWKKAN
jgi:hypothetical protein